MACGCGTDVLYAERRGEPPKILDHLLKWRAFGVLPEGGGQRDQVAGELNKMITIGNYYDAWSIFYRRPLGSLGLKDLIPFWHEIAWHLVNLEDPRYPPTRQLKHMARLAEKRWQSNE